MSDFMIKDNNGFATLSDMVSHLSQLPGVVGIVEYGGRTHTNMRLGGDYDLTVIFNKPISKNFSGIHLHVAGIPVDCMLLSIDDFTLPQPADFFHLVHLNCTILYDQNDTTKQLLEGIQMNWKKPHLIDEAQKMWTRFAAKHTIDKLEHRLFDDALYSRLFIAQTLNYVVENYVHFKGLEPGKTKASLAYMQQNDPDLHSNINAILTTTDLALQFELFKKISIYPAKDIGGMWQEGEALFHLNPGGVNDKSEQKLFIEFLFGLEVQNENT